MIFNRRIWKVLFHPMPRYGFFQPPQFDVNKDYYKTLNCSPTDSEQKIKQEYYKLAKMYHPDINKGNEEKFKSINEAYDVLSDKHRKQQYDSARSFTNNNSNSQQTNSYHNHQNDQSFNQQHYEEFVKRKGPNGSFYQQYTYRSSGNNQQFSKEQMEEMQRQAQEFMNMFNSGQYAKMSEAFKQATKDDPRYSKFHTFMNMADMASRMYEQRKKTQMENEYKRQQNVQNFANKEDKFKESLSNISKGIKGIWDQFTKK